MNAARLHLLLHVLLSAGLLVHTIDPFTMTLVVGTGAALGIITVNYFTVEKCDPTWIVFNAAGLQVDLQSKLFGQHIASQIILKAVTGFMNKTNPRKPLVLFLHGRTGTGKNFVSQLIAENIYKKGMKSSFVHFFTSVHFPHLTHQWIRGHINNCERAMFIFDEMDKMDPALMDRITPYLDYYQELDGVCRKAIFIFLSNAGGKIITQTAFHFWKAGRAREELELKDLETELSVSVFDKNSGLWHSDLIDKDLVDFFVPFLPLEYRHVVECAMAEMKARGLRPDQNVAERIANELVNNPKSTGRVFSSKGCKTISSKLYFYYNRSN